MQVEPGQDIKVISWDLDGTLYSSGDFKRRLYRSWLSQSWRPSVWRDVRVIACSQKMLQQVREAGGEWQGYDPVLRSKAEKAEIPWFAAALSATGPRPDVLQVLQGFREQGYRQIVISDYHGEYKLEALGIHHYFERIFAGEDKGVFKPSPSVFTDACRELNISPEELFHIGDREDTDGVGARRAGCQVEILY